MLKSYLITFFAGFVVNSPCPYLSSANAGEDFNLPFVSLSKNPKFRVVTERELTKEVEEEVEELLYQLAGEDIPLEFFSDELSDQAYHNCSLLSGRDSHSEAKALPAALTRLLDLGPPIVPLLLSYLDNQSLVGTRVSADRDMLICFAQRLHGNAANLREARILNMSRSCYIGAMALDDQFNRHWQPPNISQTESYHFRIGDVCFVTIGRIIGRDYQCLVMGDASTYAICSPLIDREIREKIQLLWNDARPRERAYRSLLYDFLTIGIISNNRLDEWRQGSDLQVAAASRLVKYFPIESKQVILERLSTLDIHENYFESARLNGVDVYELICALGASDDPDIIAAISMLRLPKSDHRYHDIVKEGVKRKEFNHRPGN